MSHLFGLGALLVWGYQIYTWLRFAVWPKVTLVDALNWLGAPLGLPELEWKGVEAVVHGSILWIADLNLDLLLFVMGLALLPIEMVARYVIVRQYNELDRTWGARRVKKKRQELGYED